MRRLFGLGFTVSLIANPCDEHLHRFVPVSVLATVVLAFSNDAGWQMGDSHR
ncbi:MAG: hypothetical protein RIQ49_178 [Pseudomonadota bacterium]